MSDAADRLHVRVTLDGVLATVTLAKRPMNTLSIPMLDALRRAAEMIDATAEVRAVVIRSSVAGAFVSGADLKERLAGNSPTASFLASLHGALDAIEQLSVPTIALIDGHALGGGCELALVCDFRLMSIGPARIGLPEVRLGLLAAGGGTQRMARLVGRGAATDLIVRGRLVDATEAARLGLVHRAVLPDHLDREVSELVAELTVLPPLAVAAAKHLIRDGLDRPLRDGIALEAAAMLALEHTRDADEGVRAFVEKRPPRYTGA